MTAPPAILYEDNHCLAVNKPNRMLVAGDETGDETLLELARADLKRRHEKPGNVFLGLVHRIDRPVSGVVLFAKTSKAASRLSDQFRRGTIKKEYRAVVAGAVQPSQGTLTDWLLKDRDTNLVRKVGANTTGAKPSVLKYETIQRACDTTLLAIFPQTGRSHQIRVQLAAIGHPIYGDKKYGSTSRHGGSIALHAYSLTFKHPTRDEDITVTAPLPDNWPFRC